LMVYIGQTASKALIRRLIGYGFGECVQPDEWPPRRHPWFLDNAAYRAWANKEEWNPAPFEYVLGACKSWPPDFVIAPDVVAGGADSMALSLSWVSRIPYPAYLAVQDGMTEANVAAALPRFAGLFVGGSLPWKIRGAHHWVNLAHKHGKPCHIGRVGTARRVRWAKRIGADSIDSCLPLWAEDKLQGFVRALKDTQMELGVAQCGEQHI